ncbi:MAG: hypothetical protein ABIT01_00720 [Thermoanaerobaculia bacterium]
MRQSSTPVTASLLTALGIACLAGIARGDARRPASSPVRSSVGTITFSVVDAARPDPVEGGRPREWLAQVFYPIAPAKVKGVYAADKVLLELLVAEKYYFATEPQLRGWGVKPAAAIEGARPKTPLPLPIVTISPGLGFARLNYAELAAALVGRGFVVIVIDHPYIGYTHLPDGRILRAEQDARLTTEAPADSLPAVREWTRDISVTLDRLIAAGKERAPGLAVDLSRVTATGHSIGGTAAVDACSADDRVKACIDFEGFLAGTRAVESGASRPTMVTFSRAKGRPPTVRPGEPDPTDQLLSSLSQRGMPVWAVKITGGSHTSYSDAPDVLPETLSHFGGELMSVPRSMELYTGLVEAFARAYEPAGGGDSAFQTFLDGASEVNGRRGAVDPPLRGRQDP